MKVSICFLLVFVVLVGLATAEEEEIEVDPDGTVWVLIYRHPDYNTVRQDPVIKLASLKPHTNRNTNIDVSFKKRRIEFIELDLSATRNETERKFFTPPPFRQKKDQASE